MKLKKVRKVIANILFWLPEIISFIPEFLWALAVYIEPDEEDFDGSPTYGGFEGGYIKDGKSIITVSPCNNGHLINEFIEKDKKSGD